MVLSCQQKSNDQKNKATNAVGAEIPGVPQELIAELWENCDYVDYIFHDLPFSISQSEQPAVRANLNYISPDPLGSLNPDCKPIGREFFHIKGEIAYEADVYYSDNCFYYVFMKNEKPMYANKMSDTGINFYAQIIRQVMQGQGNG